MNRLNRGLYHAASQASQPGILNSVEWMPNLQAVERAIIFCFAVVALFLCEACLLNEEKPRRKKAFLSPRRGRRLALLLGFLYFFSLLPLSCGGMYGLQTPVPFFPGIALPGEWLWFFCVLLQDLFPWAALVLIFAPFSVRQPERDKPSVK